MNVKISCFVLRVLVLTIVLTILQRLYNIGFFGTALVAITAILWSAISVFEVLFGKDKK